MYFSTNEARYVSIKTLQFRSCTDKVRRQLTVWGNYKVGRTCDREVHRQARSTKRMSLGLESTARVDHILPSVLWTKVG
jgi:hypothetical protein